MLNTALRQLLNSERERAMETVAGLGLLDLALKETTEETQAGIYSDLEHKPQFASSPSSTFVGLFDFRRT